MYNFLSSPPRSLYMPFFRSACITNEYLQLLFLKKVYQISKADIKLGTLTKSATVEELLEELKKNLQNKQFKPTGFNPSLLPDKEWIVNVLHSLWPSNSYFSMGEHQINQTIDTQ